MKIFGRVIMLIIFLVLIFFAAFSIFSIFIPMLQGGVSFLDAIKEIGKITYDSIIRLLGV